MHTLAPALVVPDVAAAVAFYVDALGAREVARYTAPGGALVHVDLVIGDSAFAVMIHAPAFHNHAPSPSTASPVVLQLRVADVIDVVARVQRGGGVPLAGPVVFCGERMARARDPFGHLWLLVEEIESLSPEEKQRRRDALFEAGRT